MPALVDTFRSQGITQTDIVLVRADAIPQSKLTARIPGIDRPKGTIRVEKNPENVQNHRDREVDDGFSTSCENLVLSVAIL